MNIIDVPIVGLHPEFDAIGLLNTRGINQDNTGFTRLRLAS